ncbi:MAG TPA: SHOCT domain-containing protein, partial [Longilinea sp.]|nr:SHOCT domain-containing protein [Longilinea sp.]
EKRVSMINGFHGYSAGERVKVKYDPAHKDHLIVSGVEISSGRRERSGGAVPDEDSENPDVTEKLEKLSRLHENGELSDAEFAAAKKKLLG